MNRTTVPCLDWSGRNGAPLATVDWSISVSGLPPCELCGRPAMLRAPAGFELRGRKLGGKPCHKTCAERELAATPGPTRRRGRGAGLPANRGA